MNHTTRRVLKPTLLAVAAFAALPAMADPYYAGASASYTHYTNVAQAASGGASDSVVTTSLFAGLDQPIGRQRLHAQASVDNNKFQSNSQLDNVSYRLTGGLDWSTVDRLSGNINAYTGRALSQFGADGIANNGLPGAITRTLIQTDGVSAVARIGVVTRLTGELSLSHDRSKYSSSNLALDNFNNNSVNSAGAALRYQFSSALTAGLGVRRTNGDYADRTPADHYRRNDIDILANYTPGSASTVQAHLSHTTSHYDVASTSDLSGVTGGLTWNWQLSGKTNITTDISRDTGRASSLIRAADGGPNLLDDQSSLNTTVQVRANYQISSKVSSYAGIGFINRTGTFALSSTSYSDNLQHLFAGVNWDVSRSVSTGCDLNNTSRSLGTSDFSYSSIGCQIKFTLK